MDQFESESTSIEQLLRFNQSFYLVVIYRLLVPILLLTLFCISLTACNQISLQKKTGHHLISSHVVSGEQKALTYQKNMPTNLAGFWKIGFRYHGKTELGSMELQQDNQKFSGHGKDENGVTFKIEQGQIC